MADDASGIGDGGGTVAGAAAVVGEVLPALPEVRPTGGAELAITTPVALEATGKSGLIDAAAWQVAGLALVEAASDDAERVRIRDAAVAVKVRAEQDCDVARQCAAARVEQRAKRAIGQAHPREQGVRSDLSDRSDKSAVLPRQTISDYRLDAESVSERGFEAVADAADAAGQPLDRATVRRAGELERAGEDPADAVREPKTRPMLRDADRAPSRVMVEAAQVFFGERLTIDGPIVIGNGQDAPLDLDIYMAHETGIEWVPDPCPGWWRPHIWLAPPPRMQERYAWLLRNAFDRPRDRRPQSAVMAVGGETHKTWMRDLLSTVHAVHWLDPGSAPWRMLLFWGFPRDRVLDAWAQQGLRAWVSVSDRGGEWPRD